MKKNLKKAISLVLTVCTVAAFATTVNAAGVSGYGKGGLLHTKTIRTQNNKSNTSTFTYNDDGYQIKCESVDSQGNKVSGVDNELDENGNVLKETRYRYEDGQEKIYSITEKTFTSTGDVLTENYKTDSDGTLVVQYDTTFEYEYDSNGQISKITETKTGGDGLYVDTTVSVYNEKNLLVSVEQFNDSTNARNKFFTTYEYDENGYLITTIQQKANGAKEDDFSQMTYVYESKHVYTNDEKGRMTSNLSYEYSTQDSDWNSEHINGEYYTYTDFENGYDYEVLIKKQSGTETPTVSQNIKYEYDNYGNLIKHSVYNSSSGVIDSEPSIVDEYIYESYELKITSGQGQSVDVKTATGASFESNITTDSVANVTVDGKTLDASNYTVSGELYATVTINSDYLKTLANGTHTVVLATANGSVEATFTITGSDVVAPAAEETTTTSSAAEENNAAKSPQTGDTTNLTLWIVLLGLSLAGITSALVLKSKKKYGNK